MSADIEDVLADKAENYATVHIGRRVKGQGPDLCQADKLGIATADVESTKDGVDVDKDDVSFANKYEANRAKRLAKEDDSADNMNQV